MMNVFTNPLPDESTHQEGISIYVGLANRRRIRLGLALVRGRSLHRWPVLLVRRKRN